MESNSCACCQRELGNYRFGDLRPGVREILLSQQAQIAEDDVIGAACLNRARLKFALQILETDVAEVLAPESDIRRSEAVAEKVAKIEMHSSVGEKIADRVAAFGGSWTFIGLFLLAMIIWITMNVMAAKPVDPFPFILLNLMLSSVAALQAPVIMMSQNRVEAKDRRRSESDFQTNIEAEQEVRSLHEKLDYLLATQLRQLLEIQAIQIEMIQELRPAENAK